MKAQDLEPQRKKSLTEFLKILPIDHSRIFFNETSEQLRLIHQALIHPSYYLKDKSQFLLHRFLYSRLEFLGDSFLHDMVSNYLYKQYPNLDGGGMSLFRSSLVSGKYLVQQAKRIQLGRQLLMGKAEYRARLYEHGSILENAFECFIGAVGLSYGRRVVGRFYLSLVKEDLINKEAFFSQKNDKTCLQEIMHKRGLNPVYRVEEVKGPSHRRSYEVSVYVNEEKLGTGTGNSVKEAEQNSAKDAILRQPSNEPLEGEGRNSIV